MKKTVKKLMIAASAVMIAIPAYAGQTQPALVDVDLDNMIATGDLVSARTEKKTDSFIGCGTRNIELPDSTLFSWAFCQAQDAEDELVTCFTQNPELVQTIREINDTSFVTFSWRVEEDESLTCTRMGFSTQSFYLGKEIKGNKVNNDD